MSPQGRKKILLTGALSALAAVALSLLLRGGAWGGLGTLLLGPALLLVGFGAGSGPAWGLGLAAMAWTLALWGLGWVGPDAALVGLCLQGVSALFPKFFEQAARQDGAAHEALRGPVAAERDALRVNLGQLHQQAREAERNGRETDALFHAGREISKLLTLSDTLEFSREVIHDTLKQADSPGAPMFALALVDDERSLFSIGAVEGLDPDQVALLERGFEENQFYQWLRQAGAVLVPSVAAESSLKGVPLPAGVRSLLSVPLVIEEQAIGWVVVLDTGESALPGRDFSNLKILCSQIAIGIEKATLYDRLQRLSVTDGLTGLTVHRHFQSRLDEELKRAERYREPLSLVMSDIDHFKDFNDTWGHVAGDAVLKAVAGVMQRGLGPSEMAVRYGGEEFVLVLPRHTKEMAIARAEALRDAVRTLSVHTESKNLNVTISLGVASYPDDAMTKTGLIDRSDAALYQSKKNGRNRVTAAQAPAA